MINRTSALILAILVFIGFAQAQSQVSYDRVNGPVHSAVHFSRAANVNIFDTIVINLDQVVLHADTIDIPVAIVSDDTVNALDFSLKYDHARLQYDSTLSLRSYISALAYYNPNDSTIRYTSYSTVNYEKDTTIVIVRFVLVNGTGFVMPFDFSHLNGYLNGDACTIVVKSDAFQSVQEVGAKKQWKIWPMPANDRVRVNGEPNANMVFFTLDGSKQEKCFKTDRNGFAEIATSDLPSGMYVLVQIDKPGVSTPILIVHP